MKNFIHENFLLENKTAEKLYHDFAKSMPIIDYHCHLSPQDISINRKFENLTRIWLDGDHYKWRLMRANGVTEEYCTGNKDDYSKFLKWAETLPFTLRNPIYHWAHMELNNPFNINDLLNKENAKEVYEHCNSLLTQDDYSFCSLLEKWNVESLCTTDDPIDSLEYHKTIKDNNIKTKVLPAWRPDKAMAVENLATYNNYINSLEAASDMSVNNYSDLIGALTRRHDFFHQNGCRLSDHGLETFYSENYTENELKNIFNKIRSAKELSEEEILKFRSGMLVFFAEMDHAKGWVQQFHIGPLRNNNTRMMEQVGPDTGFDSIGDFEIARPMSGFFAGLDKNNKLCKTIIYNLNPKDNEVIASMAGNFQDGSYPGKIQWGSAWWFLDQKDGMEKQINTLSNFGLLSRFVGMLTDSRSVLSYSRHEYFRRILCNMIGTDVEKGLLPADIELLGDIVKNISYFNAKKYFDFG
ncbi:glucuronate isomerase [Bacteroidota bacterium]